MSNRDFSEAPPSGQSSGNLPPPASPASPELPVEDGPADPVTRRYSNIMGMGIRVALVVMIIAYVVYLAGLMPRRISNQQLPQYWKLPARQYVEQADMPHGWQWVGQVRYGDVATIVPAVIMAVISMVCGFSILPLYVRRRDFIMAAIVLAQLAVMFWAAVP